MTKITMTLDVEKLLKNIKDYEKNLTKKIQKKTEETLDRTIKKLKKQLSEIYNTSIRSSANTLSKAPQSRAQEVAEESTLGRTKAPGKDGDFYSSTDSNVIKAHLVNTRNGNGNTVARVRSEINEDDTYEDHLEDFRSTLLEKTFSIQQPNGDYKYFIIPKGSALESEVLDDVKIFCSSYIDNTRELVEGNEGEGFIRKGTSEGRKKFARDQEKGFTEFTLKERAFKAIESKGLDITDLINDVQHGEYEAAHVRAKQIADNQALQKQASYLESATKRMQETSNLSPAQSALGKGNKAIKGFTIKRSKQSGAGYTITIKSTGKEFFVTNRGRDTDPESRWGVGRGNVDGQTGAGVDDTFGTKSEAVKFVEDTYLPLEQETTAQENADKLATEVAREAAIWTKETSGVLYREISSAVDKAVIELNKKR